MQDQGASGFVERRRHPRYRINLKKHLVVAGEHIPVMDISWGGICFYGTQHQAEGAVIEFEEGELVVAATVLECADTEEADSPEYPYRIRCQFVEDPHHPQIEALMEFVLDQEGIGL